MIETPHEKLGELLVAEGKLDPDDLELAIKEHRKTGERLGIVLTKMGFVSEEDAQRAVAQQLNVPFMRLGDVTIQPEIMERVPAKLVNHYTFLPLSIENGVLRIAMEDPSNIDTIDNLRILLHLEVEPVVATVKDIKEAIRKYYGIGADTMEELVDEEVKEETIKVTTDEVEDIAKMAEDASIVRFVNQIIAEGFTDRATDIHIEPLEKELRIRYRIDGVLYEAAVPPAIKRFQSAIISRVKIMADLNIAERRLPQDGKIKIKMGEKEYDLRVSTIPTPQGENIVIRILSRDSELCRLDRLGFDSYNLRIVRELIQKPHGIILLTGPTGSGKSTTLYAGLSEINTLDKKIITIEDPIEYRIHGATQIQVRPAIGLSFARALRTILRHDPDIIMVGEIRDQETAQITIRTALTGHLVFSTLHTNDACSAVTRLLDMEIEPFLVSSSVLCIIAQRLVRVLCTECKQPFTPPKEIIRQINLLGEAYEGTTFYRAVGCELCRYTGYRGRTAIVELAKLGEALRRLIVERAPANQIRQEAIRQGMRPIRLDGWHKVKQGATTIEEVLRVTLEDEFMEFEDFTPLMEALRKTEAQAQMQEEKPRAQQ